MDDITDILKHLIEVFECEAGVITRPVLYIGREGLPASNFLDGIRLIFGVNKELFYLYGEIIADVRQENGWEPSPLDPATFMLRAGKPEKEITDAILKMELEAYKRILTILQNKDKTE